MYKNCFKIKVVSIQLKRRKYELSIFNHLFINEKEKKKRYNIF